MHRANIWKRIFRWNLSCIIYKLRLIEQSWVFIFGFVSKIWFTIAKKAVQTTYAQIIIVQGKTVHASNRTLVENKPSNWEHAGFAWRKYAAYVYFRFIQHAAFALMRLYKYKEVCLLVESWKKGEMKVSRLLMSNVFSCFLKVTFIMRIFLSIIFNLQTDDNTCLKIH